MSNPAPAPGKYPRTYGFRILWTDPIFIVLSIFMAWKLSELVGLMGYVPVVVLAHFFLFCNVFRVGTIRELIWTVLFLTNCTLCFFYTEFTWLKVIGVQAPVTLGVILSAIFGRDYHGIGARKINPNLDEYLNG